MLVEPSTSLTLHNITYARSKHEARHVSFEKIEEDVNNGHYLSPIVTDLARLRYDHLSDSCSLGQNIGALLNDRGFAIVKKLHITFDAGLKP